MKSNESKPVGGLGNSRLRVEDRKGHTVECRRCACDVNAGVREPALVIAFGVLNAEVILGSASSHRINPSGSDQPTQMGLLQPVDTNYETEKGNQISVVAALP